MYKYIHIHSQVSRWICNKILRQELVNGIIDYHNPQIPAHHRNVTSCSQVCQFLCRLRQTVKVWRRSGAAWCRLQQVRLCTQSTATTTMANYRYIIEEEARSRVMWSGGATFTVSKGAQVECTTVFFKNVYDFANSWKVGHSF